MGRKRTLQYFRYRSEADLEEANSQMTGSHPIDLPFTRASVELLLRHGAAPDSSPYTHKEIAQWCDRFWCQYLDVDAEEEIEQLLPVLTDVETQWDLYLANKYSVEELRSRSFDGEKMPAEWFVEWLDQIEK